MRIALAFLFLAVYLPLAHLGKIVALSKVLPLFPSVAVKALSRIHLDPALWLMALYLYLALWGALRLLEKFDPGLRDFFQRFYSRNGLDLVERSILYFPLLLFALNALLLNLSESEIIAYSVYFISFAASPRILWRLKDEDRYASPELFVPPVRKAADAKSVDELAAPHGGGAGAPLKMGFSWGFSDAPYLSPPSKKSFTFSLSIPSESILSLARASREIASPADYGRIVREGIDASTLRICDELRKISRAQENDFPPLDEIRNTLAFTGQFEFAEPLDPAAAIRPAGSDPSPKNEAPAPSGKKCGISETAPTSETVEEEDSDDTAMDKKLAEPSAKPEESAIAKPVPEPAPKRAIEPALPCSACAESEEAHEKPRSLPPCDFPLELFTSGRGNMETHVTAAAALLRGLGYRTLLLWLEFTGGRGELALAVAGVEGFPGNYFVEEKTGAHYLFCRARIMENAESGKNSVEILPCDFGKIENLASVTQIAL